MIDWLIFIPACLALNLAFGPNNLLSMTHGAKSGIVFAQKAAFGRLFVFVPMIAISALGLGVILTTSTVVFNVVKVIGAIYLIWLGISLWRSSNKVDAAGLSANEISLKEAFKTEGLVASSNPKAILIFAAFFPQFVSMDAYWLSYLMLGGAFIILEAVAIFTYAALGRFAASFAQNKLPSLQRVSGGTMCVFGLLLLVSPQPTRG